MSRITTNRGLRNMATSNENQAARMIGKTGGVTGKPLGLGGIGGQVSTTITTRRALASSTNITSQLHQQGDLKRGLGIKGQTYNKHPEPVKCQTSKESDENEVVKALTTTSLVAEKVVSKIPKISVGQKKQEAESLGFSGQFLLPKGVEDIDSDDGNNVLLAPEYVNDIYRYLRYLERKQTVGPNFLAIQKQMTPKMRSVLVDWLVNIHKQFKLLPETLYMGVSIMDRFFEKQVVSKDKIQLVGVTAFFIASKFEEIYPPDLSDFVEICDSLYSKRDILKMETVMLATLKFELGRPLPLHFLRRNSKAAHADPTIHTMAKYLMELTLVEHVCSHWTPSILAAVALYVTLKVLSTPSSMDDEGIDESVDGNWTPTLAFYAGYSEQQMQPYAAQLCKIIERADKSRFQNIRLKYKSTKNLCISVSPALQSSFIRDMADKAV